MEVDLMETVEHSKEDAIRHRETARLTTWVALTVALLAAFMGICKIKADKIVQGMERAETERLDDWNFYQARNVREDVANGTVTQLTVAAIGAPAPQQAGYRDVIAKYQGIAADQNKKKEELRVQALEDQKVYDALKYRDDQFDLSEAMIALAISLLAMTALTHKRWLFAVALVPTAFGVLMGLAGLLSWHIHLDIISRLFS
jgi:hypothetical protein